MNAFRISSRRAALAIQATAGLFMVLATTIGAPHPAEARGKSFYLTPGSYEGDAALKACASGFHMASLWEIRDTSTLQYNVRLGLTRGDSGSGPPTGEWGWIRTGSGSSTYGNLGVPNCAAWTTNQGDPHYGTLASLSEEWDVPSSPIVPWMAAQISCDHAVHVWCVRQ